jgi:hypothetical protein
MKPGLINVKKKHLDSTNCPVPTPVNTTKNEGKGENWNNYIYSKFNTSRY